MTQEIIGFSSEVQSPSVRVVSRSATGLREHARIVRRRHQGMPRWLALAMLAGVIVAAAFVTFVAR